MVFACEVVISDVARFATLFQLWAGVCVLCFYDKFLDKLVAGESRVKTQTRLTDFKQRLHGLMSDKQHRDFSKLIDSSLNNYKNCIIHLGKLSFCFCVVILFLSALDGYRFACQPVLITAIGFVVYAAFIMFYRNVEWAFRMWSFIIPAIVMFIVFSLPLVSDDAEMFYEQITEQIMAVILLSALLCVPVFGMIMYYWEKIVFKALSHKVDGVETEFQNYTMWKTLPSKENFNKITDSEIIAVLTSGKTATEKQDSIDRYFYDQTEKCFSLLRFRHYVVFYCRSRREYIILHSSEIILWLVLALSVAFYIFMEIMCWTHLS